VWGRKRIAVDTCPKSYITAESEAFLEDFLVRKSLHIVNLDELTARQADAFVILEQALAEELNDAQHDTR
jgi:hypothetical protein